MNHKQLIFAREYRGLSQDRLSKSIKGLSQPNLSKFEKGLGTLSVDIQEKIMQKLDFPLEFFERKLNANIENGNYRKRSTISKATQQLFEKKCKIIGYLIDQFYEEVEWPDFNFNPLNVEEGYTADHVARINRRLIGLKDDEPVKNICHLLESNGIIIYEIDEIDKFDGVSFISEKGIPLIIINKNYPNDRKRFTLAHELGHILLHNECNFPVSDYRVKEKEANEFASEFLMPAKEIKPSLFNLKLSYLGEIKRYWLTSMGSILRRARDLDCISEDRYRFFLIEMSRNGYNKDEPIKVFIDRPTCFKNAYNLFTNELCYSKHEMKNLTALPDDILDEFLNTEKIIKLKVI